MKNDFSDIMVKKLHKITPMSHYYLITYDAIFQEKVTTLNKTLVSDKPLDKNQIKGIIKQERSQTHPDQTGEEIVIVIYRNITEEHYKSLIS